MSKILYLDTNVYLDYLDNRTINSVPYGEFAFNLLNTSASCKYSLLISDVVVFELNKYVSQKQIDSMFLWLKKKLIRFKVGKNNKNKARRYEIHYPDYVHAMLAEKYGAILVSHHRALQTLGAISI